ncbi:MAG: hypothetical protein LC790_16825 [Actinobacteria bacterium]|nr:hypothetical protein [Actinomycetota bacterium]
MFGLAAVVLACGMTAWAASDDPCQSGFDECSWTQMQWLAYGLMPVLFLVALSWFLVALIHTVRAIDNRET